MWCARCEGLVSNRALSTPAGSRRFFLEFSILSVPKGKRIVGSEGRSWCTEWACEQEGRPWGTGTNHGDEAVFAREGEAQLHAVQPVFSRQGETQLREVQPLPPLQAERRLRGVQWLPPRQAEIHMQRVQNGARGSAEFEAGQARAAEFAGTKARAEPRAGDRDQARTFRQSKRARHRRVIGVIYQAIGKSDW